MRTTNPPKPTTLTNGQALAIRYRRWLGEQVEALARRYGVRPSTIRLVLDQRRGEADHAT